MAKLDASTCPHANLDARRDGDERKTVCLDCDSTVAISTVSIPAADTLAKLAGSVPAFAKADLPGLYDALDGVSSSIQGADDALRASGRCRLCGSSSAHLSTCKGQLLDSMARAIPLVKETFALLFPPSPTAEPKPEAVVTDEPLPP